MAVNRTRVTRSGLSKNNVVQAIGKVVAIPQEAHPLLNADNCPDFKNTLFALLDVPAGNENAEIGITVGNTGGSIYGFSVDQLGTAGTFGALNISKGGIANQSVIKGISASTFGDSDLLYIDCRTTGYGSDFALQKSTPGQQILVVCYTVDETTAAIFTLGPQRQFQAQSPEMNAQIVAADGANAAFVIYDLPLKLS